ncbi:MAG TPA: hypothetical protein VEF90_04310 [Xanthobacteraceae bacterium]|nr:hypothetical protein [Xanthobacteraceae bacterium]
MRAGVSIGAALIITACAFATAPAAAQDATAPDLAATPPDAADAPAEPPLTPEEATALGNALSFDPANLADATPAKPLRLQRLGDSGKIDVSHGDKPDAPGTLVMQRPLTGDWQAKVGGDVSLATPADGAALSKPLPVTGGSQDSGAAWASVGFSDLASVATRASIPAAIRASSAPRSSAPFPSAKHSQ